MIKRRVKEIVISAAIAVSIGAAGFAYGYAGLLPPDPAGREPVVTPPSLEGLPTLLELNRLLEEGLIAAASTPSLRPVDGRTTSRFGYRRSPFGRARDFHPGLDIAAAKGTPILSAADGVVTYAGYRKGYGKTVILDHGFGMTTRYGHASELLVKKGETVKRGAQIARVGSTGRSTGPHLHYEIQVNGVPVDPGDYISTRQDLGKEKP
jgi:murein DD-endopeptidase MepM/ murein hydrolase activator NlpD